MAEIKLSDAQKARIERNRQRALMLRNARLSNRPYPEIKSRDSAATSSTADASSASQSSSARVIDTGGGFLLDPEDEETLTGAPKNLVEEPGQPLWGLPRCKKTCEVFLCFVTIMFVLSIVLTSLFSLFYVTREGDRFLHRG